MPRRPPAAPAGNATFTYNVSDRASGAWAIGRVTIQVATCPVPLPICPVKAVNDAYEAPCGADRFIPPGRGLLANDYSNASRPDLIVVSVARAQGGTVDAFWPNGTFVFVRAPGFVGAAAGRARGRVCA